MPFGNTTEKGDPPECHARNRSHWRLADAWPLQWVGCYSNPVLFVTGALEPAIYACAVRLDLRVVGGQCTEPAPVVWISAGHVVV
jgi:hypothetical protein